MSLPREDDNTLGGREVRTSETLEAARATMEQAVRDYAFKYGRWAFDRAADIIASTLDHPEVAYAKYEIDAYTEKFAEIVRRVEVLGAMLRGETVGVARVRSELELGEGNRGYKWLCCPCEKREAYLHTERVDHEAGETHITMSCENCDRWAILHLEDHKGQVHIRWLDPEEERVRKLKTGQQDRPPYVASDPNDLDEFVAAIEAEFGNSESER